MDKDSEDIRPDLGTTKNGDTT